MTSSLLNQAGNPAPWLVVASAAAAALLVGLVLSSLLRRALLRWLERNRPDVERARLKAHWRPVRIVLPLLAMLLGVPLRMLPPALGDPLRQLLSLALVASITWLLVRGVFFVRDLVLATYNVQVRDNLKARAVHTQVNVLAKVLAVVLVTIGVASGLMTFDKVRQVGTSILASAGVIGIIVGFSAQKSIATLFAGLQLAVSQPIRLDDVVIVEGEWGRVEEVTLTYVVVRIWDLRRLILPVTYFLEKPFQNWTRVSADLLGTVFLYTDYSVPVEAVREELHRLVKDEPLWDGKVVGLQVTDTTDKTVELRALVSAADASAAWDLRCRLREQLIGFLQRNYPDALPRIRAEIDNGSDEGPVSPPARPG